MKNNKGFTVVELLVSIALTSVIIIFLIEMLLVLKELFVDRGVKTKLLTKQAILTQNLNNDIQNKTFSIIRKCEEEGMDICVDFLYVDESGSTQSKRLVIDRGDNYIRYDGIATNLVSGSQFGNIVISYEKVVGEKQIGSYDSMLTIDVPIYHNLLERENYGFNIVYQYNSKVTSVSNLNIIDTIDADKKIYLIGGDDIKFKDIDYTDPGYYIVDSDGHIINDVDDKAQGEPSVKVSGFVGNTPGEIYYLTYTIYDMNGSKMSEVVRRIECRESSIIFSMTGSGEEFEVGIDGTYEIELWGASGGGTALMRGKGGYTKATIDLTTTDKVYVFVGGSGTSGTANRAASGGYNGGGASGVSDIYFASSGGGASDVRLGANTLASRILVAGGGGGGGSRSDSVYTCNGGAGGGQSGTTGSCSSDSYLGQGGTQTAGGSAASYTANEGVISSPATGGNSSGVGGNGATYTSADNVKYAAGGGGGGFYGGGGGARYGGGGGGSGFCSAKVSSCDTFDGKQTFPSVNGLEFENGHDGNGYVKITLKSIKINVSQN